VQHFSAKLRDKKGGRQMSKWQMMKAGEPTVHPIFDDGGTAQPGEDGFSTDAVKAHVATLGDEADGFNYVGPSQAANLAECGGET
jgi:hypothetical protein